MDSLALAVIATFLGLLAVGLQWVITGRLFPRSIPLDHVLAMSRLDVDDIAKGLMPITQFYEWSQEGWNALAKGAGGAAVSVLLAVVGLVIGDPDPAGASGAIPSLMPLLILLLIVALLAWLRSSRTHLDFAEDLVTVSEATQI